jgi:uncharacterized membrane protein
MLTENRIDQFKADVATMKVKTPGGRRDTLIQGAGALLMVVGAVAAYIVYQSSTTQSDARNIQSQIILALFFLTLSVIGAALFVFASLTRFLRLWMLRQVYESQEQVERVAAALRSSSTP